jgi:hypothetical protein
MHLQIPAPEILVVSAFPASWTTKVKHPEPQTAKLLFHKYLDTLLRRFHSVTMAFDPRRNPDETAATENAAQQRPNP